MPEQYYKEALKLGQREVRACVSRGEHPYLPLLDDFVTSERITTGSDLGTKWVPSELIVGTRSAARSNAFAKNFMPVLGEMSEFATKWNALCNAHVEEGIRDPITCYEYMNRFYVEEGNKRVSVLKFFGAPTIYAHVYRIMPEQNGSKEVELYNAFLEFQRCSRMHLPEFSKPQSYQRLQRLMGKEPDEVWTEDEKKDFMASYHHFREAYSPQGKKEDRAVGDALLTYIEVYGYGALRGKTEAEIKKDIARLREEINLAQEAGRQIEVKTDPKDKPAGLLSKVLPSAKPIKVAFVHDKTPETSGWTFGHECGRLHIERVFGSDIETSAYYNALDDNNADGELEQAIADGNTVIFTTSPRLLQPSLRAAVEHPKVTVLNCSLNTSHRYIRTYYARMYEIKFIIGAIAGSLAQSSDVGYICDYPIFGQVAGINAFALGVQMVNPLTKVVLEWSSVGGGLEAATQRLRERGIKLISTQDTKRFRERENTSFGLSIIDENGQTPLARPLWLWGSYYESIIRSIRDGTFKSDYEGSNRAINYYWGLSAGVVDLQCYDVLPESVRRLAKLLKDSVISGVEPFMGPLFDRERREIIGEEQSLTLEQIISMDWLVENVVGSIPSYEELDDMGKATADVVGVEASTKEKGDNTAKKEAQ